MSMPLRVGVLLLGLAALAAILTLLLPGPQPLISADGPAEQGPALALPAVVSATPQAAPLRSAAVPPPSQRELLAPGSERTGAADAADPELLILVCDANDKPVADVPVGLRAGEGGRSPFSWVTATRAPDGIAHVPHPRALLQKTAGPAWATLMLPMRDASAVALDRQALPREPVKLLLPATGRVVVQLEDPPRATADKVTVTVAAAPDPKLDEERMAVMSAPANADTAVFPFVGLGLTLLVRARRPGQNDDTQLAVTGPVTPGETVLVRLRVQPPPERTVLVLHLRDGDNQPFEQKHVEVALEARNGNSSSSSTFGIDTDSEGVLRLSVEDSYRTMPERSLRLRGKWRNQQDAGEAMVTLPAALLPGENDLGIVPLLLSPLVCGGTVVDHLGTAVEGAQLQVHVLPATGTAAPEPRQVRGLRGRSDHDGHFALRGVCPAGELSLRVAAAGHLPSTQPFLLGTGSLRIELAAAAALTGSVRLDDVITAPDVLVELVTASGESSQRLDVRGALGEFRFDALQPGVATVRIRVLGEVDGGLVVAELPLRSGEQTRDPRLQAVDLSNGRRAVHFTVVDSDGRPVQEAKVVVLAGKDQHAFEGYLLTAGQGRIVTRANPLEVLVFATGYRAARVSELADGARIVLPSPLSLHLQLPPECPPPAAPFTLEVRLEPRNSAWPSQASYRFFGGLHSEHSGDGQLPWLQATTATCGPGGDVLVQLFEPGTHAISWRLSRHQPSDRTDQWVVNEPQTVEVRDVPTEQQLRAGPSAEQLDAAKARLGG